MDDVVMLSSSATRHSCKVCGKGFPCGRSLGGHMRSHALAEVAAAAAAAADEDTDSDDDDERRWGARASNGVAGAGGGGYGLRENPKKTRRLSGSGSNDDEDACHDRGELLSSCRPVFGHVRRHAPGGGGYDAESGDVRVEVEETPEEEDMLIRSEAALVMAAPAPRRRRRSMRVPAPAPPPSSRDAFDKEPEDVALCLIMLSRDTAGLWGSAAEEEYSPEKGTKQRDSLAMNGFYHDADSDDNSALLQYADAEITKSKKRKNASTNAGEKRSRYECPGCGRAFQSYQALGGHRASHKRINSNCSTTKVAPDQPEPSVETNASLSTPSAAPGSPEADDADRAVATAKAKQVTKFECPICFKVFGSGQALGGHKRSHSIAGELYERSDAVIVDTEQSLIAAGFLDLNLPAPGAED